MNFKNIFGGQRPFISFTTDKDLDDTPKPVEAKRRIPEWYKSMSSLIPNSSIGEPATVKKCIPFLDAVSHGYIIPLWSDLLVQVFYPINCFDEANNFLGSICIPDMDTELMVGKPMGEFERSENPNIIARIEVSEDIMVRGVHRDDAVDEHNVAQIGGKSPHKKLYPLSDHTMKFRNPWVIETSKGWSVHIKNPPNRFENLLELYEGVVDTDEYLSNINLPFFWKGTEVGEFLIPKGTPIAQVIPFKREKCDLRVGKIDTEQRDRIQARLGTRITDVYKQEFWHKRKKYDKYGVDT